MSLFTADMPRDESCQSKAQVHAVANWAISTKCLQNEEITTDCLVEYAAQRPPPKINNKLELCVEYKPWQALMVSQQVLSG